MKICMGCMNEYPDSNLSCPICGRCGVVNTGDALKTEVVLSGRYTIGRQLGRGENTVAYIAMDNILNNRVVVKEYLPKKYCERNNGGTECYIRPSADQKDFAKGIRRFAVNARLFSNFRDYNNCPIYYDVFKENNTVYYVREYIEGENYTEFCENKGHSVQERLEVLKNVLYLLNKLHNLGVYSGAVKPGNIIITKNSEVVLTDFAVASFSGEECSYKDDNPFSAPELYRNADLSAVTDVYSVAACAYYALTGVIPQDGFNRTINDTLQAPFYVNGDIDKGISDAVMSGMELDPFARCENTVAFMKLLFAGDLLDVVNVSTVPVGIRDDALADEKTMRIFSSDNDLMSGQSKSMSVETEATQSISAAEIRRAAAEKERKEERNRSEAKNQAMPQKTAAPKRASAKKHHLTNRGFAVLVAAAAVLIIAGGIFTVSRFIGNDSNVVAEDKKVPDVLGMTIEDAKLMIDSLDFDLEINVSEKKPHEEVAENLIMHQTPENGTVFKEGMVVEVVISSGKAKIEMKDYYNWNIDDAVNDLEELGFTVIKKEEASNQKDGTVVNQSIEKGTLCVPGDIEITYAVNNNEYDPGDYHPISDYVGKKRDEIDNIEYTDKYIIEVIEVAVNTEEDGYTNGGEEKDVIFAQYPSCGEFIPEGETIKLYVSTGVQMATVPDMQYMSREDAIAALENIGLKCNVIEEECDYVDEGHVIKQDIQYGEKVEIGSVVTITISKGSSETLPTTTEPETEAPATQPITTDAPIITTIVNEPETEAATAAPTAASTASPTEAPTEAPTEKSNVVMTLDVNSEKNLYMQLRECGTDYNITSLAKIYKNDLSKGNYFCDSDLEKVRNGEYSNIKELSLFINGYTYKTFDIIEEDDGTYNVQNIILAVVIEE